MNDTMLHALAAGFAVAVAVALSLSLAAAAPPLRRALAIRSMHGTARTFACVPLVAALVAAAPAVAQERGAGQAVTPARVALVIGNAAYRVAPLDNPVNDARLIGRALEQAGFDVALHTDLDRRGLLDALREFGNRLNDNTVAVLYYAGHGLQLRDRNYMIPIDAEIRSEDEIPITGIDVGFILGRMAHARSRVNIVILDACRNNPFGGRTVAARGLAQMDAPVGTLLAFATAPGKLAADAGGSGGNSVYALHLARHLLTPGLPVEHVFKRVREGVVRETQEQQVPWESSSLQGEFAFVPGASGTPATAGGGDAAAELAFWESIQASGRADEYRAYLRQYPDGRFVALARTRIEALTARPPQESARLRDGMPLPGDTWRYRVQDQFRIGDLYLTAKVEEVTSDGVAESWSTTADGRLHTVTASLVPGFHRLPGGELAPPEFAPYLQAAGLLPAAPRMSGLTRQIEELRVPLKISVEGEEEVVVPAGRFRATKVVLRGQASWRGRGAVSTEHVVWYAPEVRRSVKEQVSTRIGGSLRESTTFELVEYRVN